MTEISQWESENFNCFNIAAARCNQSQNFKIHREQNSTNQTEGFGSRDQNWPIRDEYFALSPFSALNGRDAKYSSRDWAILLTWHEQKKKKGDCFNFKIISPFSFPRILFSFSYSSSLFSLMLHLPFLSFHCIHLPLLSWFHFHCTCYVPCDDHQSAYFLYLSINTYLLFSWLRPVHWPLSLLVYLHIDTYLSFLSQQVMSCSFSHANQGRLTDYHLCQPGSFFDRLCFVVSGIWASEHSHHRSAHLLCRWAFIVLPWSVLCRSWASGLLLCSSAHYQQTFFFLHIFFDLNQRPLPLKPSTLLTVLARLRWWCEE